ncbi:MAG: CorA family divalent cation transporter [Candidatus Nanopelagicales bacterium]
MEVRVIKGTWAEVVPLALLPAALDDPEAVVWVDIPECDEESLTVLRDIFGFHAVALWECRERQRMPKFHPYSDHVFVVLHAPMLGRHGHVHYVELDQFISQRYLVTVHGPTNPAVPAHVPLRDTSLVWERIEAGRFRPLSAFDLSRSIVASMCEGMEETLEVVTEGVWALEQRVTLGKMGDPEVFLDEMFRTRHALLAVANVSSTGGEVYERMTSSARGVADSERRHLADNIDQFRRVQRLAAGQREYLQGVIEFYRTRTDVKMTIAAERLAVIAVVTLPITALASILGMNVIVNSRTAEAPLAVALVVMITMSAILLRWARHQGWW